MPSSLFFLLIAVAVLVTVVMMLRSQLLREKYAVLWVVVGVLIVILALFPNLLEFLAESVNVTVPSNLLFTLSILMLLGVLLQMSLEVSRLDEEARVLSEETAILRLQMERLTSEVGEINRKDGGPQSAADSSKGRSFAPGLDGPESPGVASPEYKGHEKTPALRRPPDAGQTSPAEGLA